MQKKKKKKKKMYINILKQKEKFCGETTPPFNFSY
jgi:hypothetical protein